MLNELLNKMRSDFISLHICVNPCDDGTNTFEIDVYELTDPHAGETTKRYTNTDIFNSLDQAAWDILEQVNRKDKINE